jgi:outer membrane protein assembly factor BamB
LFVSNGLVHGDKLYIASAHMTFKEGGLYCLNRHTGKEVWQFEDLKQAFSTPTIADGRLYIGEGFHDDANCKLYCIDADKGHKIWEFHTGGQTEASPVVVNNRVFFGAGNAGRPADGGADFTDGLYCVNLATAEKVLKPDSKDTLWKFPKAGYKGRLLRFGATPAVVVGRLYVGTGVDRNQRKDQGETALFCINADNGEQIWKVGVDLPAWAAPVIDGDQAFFALGNGDIFTDAEKPAGAIVCLDPANGNEKWRVNIPNGVIDRPAVDKTNIYFGSRDMHVYCLDRKDGNQKWKRFMQSPVIASVALAGDDNRTDSVIAIATDGWVCSLDAQTGDIQWNFDLTANRAVLISSPQVVLERTRLGERRHIYFGAGIGGTVQGGDTGSCRAVVYALENRLIKKDEK